MKLSSETISVLKNFATINQNLIIKSGSELSTMSAMNNILGKAKVKENFPQEFAIYDLNEFLAAISLFDNQDLYFMIRESDADYSSSNYRGWLSGTEKYSSGQNHGTQGNTWYNSSHAKLTGHSGGITNNASYGGMSGNVNIFDPLGTTGYKWQQGAHSFYNNNGTNVIGGRMTNVTQTTAASSGFSIYMSSGNIASGVFKMYGLK